MAGLERARERETIRYYETWLESRRGYLSPNNVSRSHPQQQDDFVEDDASTISRNDATWKISCDKALVAFAQLGCLRLNAKRGVVILITTTNAYILAEATQTVSLLAGGQYAGGDELWFGTASIPRSQGISEHALDAQGYTARSPEGHQYTAPALVLEDITKDPRFSARAYAGAGVTFYAGVPIVSKNGFTIGVFNVTDDKPRPGGLTSLELHFMQDIASTIMDHLENIRNDTARLRGERMVLGLGAFTEGYTSMETDKDNTNSTPDQSTKASSTNLTRPMFKGLTIFETDSRAPKPTPLGRERSSPIEEPVVEMELDGSIKAQSPVFNPTVAAEGAFERKDSPDITANMEAKHGEELMGPAPQKHSLHSPEYRRTFARAANILRQCTDSDGVMFFDASSASMSEVSGGFFGVRRTESDDSITSSEDASCNSGASSDDPEEYVANNANHPDPTNTIPSQNFPETPPIKRCELLGFSFRVSSATRVSEMVMKETEMRRFLRRYPKGMVIHFTKDGDVSSSEEGTTKDRDTRTAMPFRHDRKRAMAQELIKVVPGARNVVWLPLWDFSRSSWAAGCFIWTSRPGRLLNAQQDLIYMKAFANTIMGEINRLEAVASDQAKTSFAANISHELRSPLHGILGSIEFLQDTAVDAFQASMITTVETCGKTLLDTVNHVLDFAKLSKTFVRGLENRKGQTSTDDGSTNLFENVDLSRLIEEVIESIYAGQTFRSTGAFQANEDDEMTREASPHEHIAMRELAQRTQSKFSGAVQVILDMEKLDNWCVRTKPGAIRRIVMNLFGNALKYTDKGLVCVSLSPTGGASSDQSKLSFRVSVTDTGKGMSADFIKNHAWKPFSQEDSFASGVGLGLSIVRQITNSLGGETALQSQKNKGTVATVTLTVPRAIASGESRDLIKEVFQRVNGSKLCLLTPDIKKLSGIFANMNARAEDNISRMASSWFGLRIITSKSIFGVTADFFLYMEPPPTEYLLEEHGLGTKNMDMPLLVIAPNAFESALLRKDTQGLKDLGRTLEIISQPCGPTKFAMAIERCLDRGYSTAPPDIASPMPFERDARGIDTGIAGGNRQTRPTTLKRAQSQSVDQADAPKRHISRTHSELSGQISENLTDTLSSLDTRNVSETASRPQTASVASDDKDRNRLELNGPVLLVDDNDINLKLLVAFVRKAKFAYETAMDGLEALNLYKEASQDPKRAFKMVVIDIQMPVMNGITATREIRAFEMKNRTDPPAYIMALTGLASESTQAECTEAGVDHFLTKPLNFKEFLKRLKQ